MFKSLPFALAVIALSANAGAAWAAPGEIRVTGKTGCPSPAAIERRVRQLAPEQGRGDRATLVQIPRGPLWLELYGSDGASLGQRAIPSAASCRERVEVSAVVLATWLSELAPQTAEAIATTKVVLPPAPQTAPPAPAPVPSAPAIPAPVPGPEIVSTPLELVRPFWFAIGAAATGSLSGGHLAGGARVQVAAALPGSRWSLELGGCFDGAREISIPPGQVQWQRWGGTLGLRAALTQAPISLDVGADFLLASLHAQGFNYAIDGYQYALDPGLDLGARVLFLRGSCHPWLGANATLWLRKETPIIEQASNTTSLPQLEFFIGVGLAWTRGERF